MREAWSTTVRPCELGQVTYPSMPVSWAMHGGRQQHLPHRAVESGDELMHMTCSVQCLTGPVPCHVSCCYSPRVASPGPWQKVFRSVMDWVCDGFGGGV